MSAEEGEHARVGGYLLGVSRYNWRVASQQMEGSVCNIKPLNGLHMSFLCLSLAVDTSIKSLES